MARERKTSKKRLWGRWYLGIYLDSVPPMTSQSAKHLIQAMERRWDSFLHHGSLTQPKALRKDEESSRGHTWISTWVS